MQVDRFGRVLAVCVVLALGAASPGRAAPPTGDAPTEEEAPRTDQQIAEGLFSSTTRLTTPRQRPADCGTTNARGEIVVCGADRGEQWRVPSTTDSDPTSRQAMNTGVPRAPNVSALPDCSRGCLHFGKPTPKVLTLDLAKIPKAPVGSDADLIARGERGER